VTVYVLAIGPCVCCQRVFAFHPHRVPSTDVFTGTREPICETCMAAVNAKCIARGLPPHEILPGAYEPLPESDL
jgi:hypothetical protein